MSKGQRRALEEARKELGNNQSKAEVRKRAKEKLREQRKQPRNGSDIINRGRTREDR